MLVLRVLQHVVLVATLLQGPLPPLPIDETNAASFEETNDIDEASGDVPQELDVVQNLEAPVPPTTIAPIPTTRRRGPPAAIPHEFRMLSEALLTTTPRSTSTESTTSTSTSTTTTTETTTVATTTPTTKASTTTTTPSSTTTELSTTTTSAEPTTTTTTTMSTTPTIKSTSIIPTTPTSRTTTLLSTNTEPSSTTTSATTTTRATLETVEPSSELELRSTFNIRTLSSKFSGSGFSLDGLETENDLEENDVEDEEAESSTTTTRATLEVTEEPIRSEGSSSSKKNIPDSTDNATISSSTTSQSTTSLPSTTSGTTRTPLSLPDGVPKTAQNLADLQRFGFFIPRIASRQRKKLRKIKTTSTTSTTTTTTTFTSTTTTTATPLPQTKTQPISESTTTTKAISILSQHLNSHLERFRTTLTPTARPTFSLQIQRETSTERPTQVPDFTRTTTTEPTTSTTTLDLSQQQRHRQGFRTHSPTPGNTTISIPTTTTERPSTSTAKTNDPSTDPPIDPEQIAAGIIGILERQQEEKRGSTHFNRHRSRTTTTSTPQPITTTASTTSSNFNLSNTTINPVDPDQIAAGILETLESQQVLRSRHRIRRPTTTTTRVAPTTTTMPPAPTTTAEVSQLKGGAEEPLDPEEIAAGILDVLEQEQTSRLSSRRLRTRRPSSIPTTTPAVTTSIAPSGDSSLSVLENAVSEFKHLEENLSESNATNFRISSSKFSHPETKQILELQPTIILPLEPSITPFRRHRLRTTTTPTQTTSATSTEAPRTTVSTRKHRLRTTTAILSSTTDFRQAESANSTASSIIPSISSRHRFRSRTTTRPLTTITTVIEPKSTVEQTVPTTTTVTTTTFAITPRQSRRPLHRSSASTENGPRRPVGSTTRDQSGFKRVTGAHFKNLPETTTSVTEIEAVEVDFNEDSSLEIFDQIFLRRTVVPETEATTASTRTEDRHVGEVHDSAVVTKNRPATRILHRGTKRVGGSKRKKASKPTQKRVQGVVVPPPSATPEDSLERFVLKRRRKNHGFSRTKRP